MGDDGAWIFWIAQKTRDIAHKNQALGFQRDGGLGGGDVRIAVVNFCVLAASRGADNGSHTAPDAIAQGFCIDAKNFPDIADIDLLLPGRKVKLAAGKNLGAGEALRFSSERIDRANDFRIDFAGENLLDDVHRGFASDALALDKFGLQSGQLHRAGDRLAAPVNDDGIDADGFKKDNIARDTVADI